MPGFCFQFWDGHKFQNHPFPHFRLWQEINKPKNSSRGTIQVYRSWFCRSLCSGRCGGHRQPGMGKHSLWASWVGLTRSWKNGRGSRPPDDRSRSESRTSPTCCYWYRRNTSIFTGKKCNDWAGGKTGVNYAVQGNYSPVLKLSKR